jgi:ubiquitin-activating enzyme E1
LPLTILQVLHLGFRALDEFYRLHNYYPSPGSADDAAEVLNMVKSWSSPKSEGDMDIDGFFVDSSVVEAEQKSISWLSMGTRASLSPMAAAFGGIVGQEVLKAASGKFSPITQWLFFDAGSGGPSSL